MPATDDPVNTCMWEASLETNGEAHVAPLNDLYEHTPESDCWCRPTFDGHGWIHHSADRREFAERGEMLN